VSRSTRNSDPFWDGAESVLGFVSLDERHAPLADVKARSRKPRSISARHWGVHGCGALRGRA
jgi:hypothetical protein